MIRLAAVAIGIIAGPALALDFALPTTARQTVERNTSTDIYAAPIGVFEDDAVPSITIEGDVERAAWRVDSGGLTPFQVMRPLREQLVEAGYEIALDCAAQACGGFDFRFGTETLPGPNMYVNIRAYHLVTGLRKEEGTVQEAVTVLTSTSATSAYVQIIRAGAQGTPGIRVETSAQVPQATPILTDAALPARLERLGYAVLSDLEFDTGSTDLGAGPFASLAALAAYLQRDPALRVALVGHTDTVGGLEPNITISRARARSVRQRLITEYGVDASRLDAEGMGYLSPLTHNLNEAGREKNRRVEVVLLGRSEQ